ERGAELVVRESALVDVDPAVPRHRHDQPARGLERTRVRLGERDIHAALHHRRGDHEDHHQEHHDVDETDDVDVRVERESAGGAATAHSMRPSRTIIAISAVPKLSRRASNRLSRAAKMLYPNTAGIATLSAAAVATSASATPGATALRFPLPLTAMPT